MKSLGRYASVVVLALLCSAGLAVVATLALGYLGTGLRLPLPRVQLVALLAAAGFLTFLWLFSRSSLGRTTRS